MNRIIFLLLLLLTSCGGNNQQKKSQEVHTNSIYHWKTLFAPDSAELSFLRSHQIGRIYIRMFDVAIEQNYETGKRDVFPIATTRFNSKIPAGIEVVPTVYITNDALIAMKSREAVFAELIVERLLAISSYNECGTIREIQFDCDWTKTTRISYMELCKLAANTLHTKNIALSCTIRLHQLSESAPPVDRGVLMLYNTGTLKDPKTKNSILDIKDVKPYLKGRHYEIPLDYAYPTFGWGVKFQNGNFTAIVTNPDDVQLGGDETLRHERPGIEEILAVKSLVEKNLGKPYRSTIIYHLDNRQLNNYIGNEISKIYAIN